MLVQSRAGEFEMNILENEEDLVIRFDFAREMFLERGL